MNRRLTPHQFRSFQLLRYFLKDSFEGIHGPRTWTRTNDDQLRSIVLGLTNTDDIASVVAQKISAVQTDVTL